MKRSGALVVALLLSLAFVGGSVGGATAAADSGGFSSLQSGGVETDTVVLRATVDEDGDARWTIDYRIRLDDQNTTEAFESLQTDIRDNTSDYRGQFADRMRSTVATAENATGREMAVTNVSVTAETTFSGQYGVVSYSFDWEGFAATEGDSIRLGDSLAGLFLDADTKLVFRWPEGYELRNVDPEPTTSDEQSVTWDGPVDFGTDQPRLVVAETGLLPAWAPLVALGAFVLLALLALVGGGWYYWLREPEPESASGGVDTTAESANREPSSETAPAAESEGEPTAGTAAADSSAAGSAAESGAGGKAGAGSDTPEELLSPEERVLALLEERGGRMKQKAVTEELDWSAARTSQVVGDLRDAGKVESFRLRRENVLKFPDDGEELGGER